MALLWEGFLDDARAGNVGGTFEYFDTEAQVVIIRDDDDALISKYSEVEFGQWLDCEWINNLRIGNFGLSQFVPRHLYNGEIWAVGITPTLVPEESGRHPTPAVPQGFYIYRYKYYEDLTNLLDMFDTYEQGESQIKDARADVRFVPEDAVNRTSSIFSVGSRLIGRLGMGDSSKAFLATVFLDKVGWNREDGSLRLTGRNAIGYYLSEQTFDELTTYSGTRTSVLRDILEYSGVNMSKVFIEEHEWAMTAKFEPTDTLFYGINHIIDIFGWLMMELPDGRLVIGSESFIEIYNSKGMHSVKIDEATTRGFTLSGDGAFTRIALQSKINEVEGPPLVEEFTRTVYKDLQFFDGWGLGMRKTLYIQILEDQTEETMNELAEEYAKAYRFIGANIEREVTIRPEFQSGDVMELLEADESEYITQGIVTSVRHFIDMNAGSAMTQVTLNSGGTITEDSGKITTWTAADVEGDTRKKSIVDVVKKAIVKANEKNKGKK